MRSADQREVDANGEGGGQDSDREPRSAVKLDVYQRRPEKNENAWQVHECADTGNAINRNASLSQQVGQRRKLDAYDDSEGQNQKTENPGRGPSPPVVHSAGSLAETEICKARAKIRALQLIPRTRQG